MSKVLSIALLIFAGIWFIVVTMLLRKNRLPIKYSIFWYLFIFVLVALGLAPGLLDWVSNLFGIITISNLVIGILIMMLMVITLLLTVIVSKQKKEIKQLIQEVSILKEKKENGGKK